MLWEGTGGGFAYRKRRRHHLADDAALGEQQSCLQELYSLIRGPTTICLPNADVGKLTLGVLTAPR